MPSMRQAGVLFRPIRHFLRVDREIEKIWAVSALVANFESWVERVFCGCSYIYVLGHAQFVSIRLNSSRPNGSIPLIMRIRLSCSLFWECSLPGENSLYELPLFNSGNKIKKVSKYQSSKIWKSINKGLSGIGRLFSVVACLICSQCSLYESGGKPLSSATIALLSVSVSVLSFLPRSTPHPDS